MVEKHIFKKKNVNGRRKRTLLKMKSSFDRLISKLAMAGKESLKIGH